MSASSTMCYTTILAATTTALSPPDKDDDKRQPNSSRLEVVGERLHDAIASHQLVTIGLEERTF